MFTHAIPCGRRRTLDRNKKRLFCDAVARGASLSEAAVTLGVSLRTVQREARRDADSDRELRRSHHDAPDLQQLMQSHARSHWRATAWLLERKDPENYGRRSPSSCSPSRFEQALRTVVEAILEVTELEQRAAVYAHVNAACEVAFKRVFPAYGPCGRRLSPKDPVTPLADTQALLHALDPRTMRHIYDRPEEPAAEEPDALQPPASPGGRVPSSQTAPQPDASPGRRPGLKDDGATSFPPRLSYRYPLRTAATLNSLLQPETPPSAKVPEGPHDTSPAL